jgi:hypothetical protein
MGSLVIRWRNGDASALIPARHPRGPPVSRREAPGRQIRYATRASLLAGRLHTPRCRRPDVFSEGRDLRE